MCWLKRYIWKVGIILAGLLLLLLLMVWFPVPPTVGAYEIAPGVTATAMPTAQAAPTEDATVTALNKEKLQQDINQSQHNLSDLVWNGLTAFISALLVVLGALVGLARWFREQGIGREKRDEDRLQSAIQALGGEAGPKIGGAVMLRAFLFPIYEKYYKQIFDLAVANLRLLAETSSKINSDKPESPNSLSQTLAVLFMEAFPLLRELYSKQIEEQHRAGQRLPLILSQFKKMFLWFVRWFVIRPNAKTSSEKYLDNFEPSSLDASGIQLDHTYLYKADLRKAYLRSASLKYAQLEQADFRGANFEGANFEGANLEGANLEDANLEGAVLRKASFKVENLIKACLTKVDLSGLNLNDAKFTQAKGKLALEGVNFTKAKLRKAHFKGSILTKVLFIEADLKEAIFEEVSLIEVDFTDADNLDSVIWRNVTLRDGEGLTDQLRAKISASQVQDLSAPLAPV